MVGGQDDAIQMINKYRIHTRYLVPYQYVFIHNVYKGSVLFVWFSVPLSFPTRAAVTKKEKKRSELGLLILINLTIKNKAKRKVGW